MRKAKDGVSLHMADHCCFCDIRRPNGGTNHLILGGGSTWIEFCPSCGEKETLHNPDLGITVTVGELFRSSKEGRELQPAPAHLCMAHGQPVEEKGCLTMAEVYGKLGRNPKPKPVEDNFGSLANAFS